MLAKAIAFLIGVSSLMLRSHLPSWNNVLLNLIFIIALYCVIPKQLRCIIWLLCIGLLGFCWAMLATSHRLHWSLSRQLEGKNVSVTGIVASIPYYKNRKTSFEFQLKTLNHQPINITVQLSWYSDRQAVMFKVGQLWRLVVRLKRPWGLQNPGGFDYERWLFEKGIRATGYIRHSSYNRLIDQAHGRFLVARIRSSLSDKLSDTLKNEPLIGLIKALTIGEKSAITQNQWHILQATGTNHLMAIAGLHIGMVAGLIALLVSFCWRRFSYLTLTLPTPQAAAVSALIVAFMYSAMAGFALPTQRALIMMTTFMLGVLCRRQLSLWHAYSIALVGVLIIDPFAVLSVSFWLSFGAVGAIIYGMSGRICPRGVWWKYGRIQWVVGLGLLPITLLFFQQVSLVSLFANTIAIPWIGFIVIPFSLIGVLLLIIWPWAAKYILGVAIKAMAVIWWYLHWLSQSPFALWHCAILNSWMMIAAVVGILLLLAPKGWPGKWLGNIWLLPLMYWPSTFPHYGQAWLTLLDVNQGLSAVIQTRRHILIYDTGPKFSSEFNAGEAVILPFLRQKRITHIDTLIISHGDNDHIGGAQSILSHIAVLKILTSVPSKFPNRKAYFCSRGLKWQWDGVKFEIIFPMKDHKIFQGKNNNSCVLRVIVGDKTILLPGDIEKPAERYLVRYEKAQLPASILIAPHHGSKTSSTRDFVNIVHPRYVLFPVGYRNRFNFPSKIVKQRYQAVNAKLLEVDKTGALTFQLGSGPMRLKKYRLDHYHYWFSK